MKLFQCHQLIESFPFRFYDRNNYRLNNHRNFAIRISFASVTRSCDCSASNSAVDKVSYYEIDSLHITYRSSTRRVALFFPLLKNKRNFPPAIEIGGDIALDDMFISNGRPKAVGREARTVGDIFFY